MQSYDINTPGLLKYYYPENVLNSSAPAYRQGAKLEVVNGNVQGDHKTPNPIKFQKTTYWTSETRKVLRGDYGAQVFVGPDPSNVWLFIDMPLLELEPDFAPVYDKAMSKIYDQLRGNNEVIVDLAEGASTLRMLRNATRAVRGVGSILDIIAGQVGRHRGQQALDLVTNKWLEYRYGWKPLIGSVYDALDNIYREELPAVRVLSARSGSKSLITAAPTYLHFPYPGTSKVRHEQSWLKNRRVRLEYEFVVPQAGIWDWTSLNPSSIAWELLPFSFVADWFISVGDSLRNLENWWLWKSGFRGGFATYTGLERQEDFVDYASNTSGSDFWSVKTIRAQGDAYRELRYKRRDVVTSLPVPRGPRFRLKLGVEKFLDATALLHVLIGKRSRSWGITS